MGAATRRLGQRLAGRADGTPGRVAGGTLLGRQGTVTAVGTGTVTVLAPEDADTGDTLDMGYLGPRPRTGDAVLWVTLNTGPWALGVLAPVETTPVLGRNDNGSGSGATPAGGSSAVLTLAVTVPAGWPPGTQVKVEGDVFVSTAAGIGSSVQMSGMSAPPPTRTINQAASYDGHLVGYDLDPPTGTRTYTLTVASATAGQVATWRAPSLRAQLLLPVRAG